MSGVVDPADVKENAPSAFARINEDSRTEFAAKKMLCSCSNMPLISFPLRRNWKRGSTRYVPRFNKLSACVQAKMAEVQTHVKIYTTNESAHTAYSLEALKCGIDDLYPSDIEQGDAILIVARAGDVVKKPSLTRCLNTKP